jgi:hypothetical protein
MMLRRRSRTDRWADEVKGVSPVAYIVAGVVLASAFVALGVLHRRRLWKAVAVVADAVEEVADTVEDAAEDVRDAARARAEAKSS